MYNRIAAVHLQVAPSHTRFLPLLRHRQLFDLFNGVAILLR